jgi:hypothetical protein
VVNFPITFTASDAGGFSEGHTVTLESNLVIFSATLLIGDADRPAIDCVVSAWSPYSDCTKACGTGSKEKTRTVTKNTHYGGVACPTLSSSTVCNTQLCNSGLHESAVEILGFTPIMKDADTDVEVCKSLLPWVHM